MATAPIVLFVYNRPLHTRQTVEALGKNELASESDLIIYSDGPKTDQDVGKVNEVRKYLRQITGFRTIRIHEKTENFGLANSVIQGVTDTINECGKVIVLEDDLVTSPCFLEYMNCALDKYQHEKNVWHISGWNYSINPKGLPDTFFWRTMNCWGWATWADRWVYFHKDPERLIREWGKDKIYKFNLDGASDFWSQVTENASGIINTWAIFWYATIFENQGLCLNPVKSLVRNIGLDGSGENCEEMSTYDTSINYFSAIYLPDEIYEFKPAVSLIKNFYLPDKENIFHQALLKLRSYFVFKNSNDSSTF